MAGPNLSDELDLDARILWSLFLASPVASELRTGGGRSLLAKACGATDAQVFTWLRGESMPPPHQARVFMAAACDRDRQRTAHSAGYRASLVTPPAAAETTEAGMKAAVKELAKDFPAWAAGLPEGHESIGTEKPKLVWSADPPGDWPRVYGATVLELRAKMVAVDVARRPASRAGSKRTVV
jgi:hypothetical protein